MHILFLTNYFPPEIGSGPHLPFELGETLVQRGHEVTVVTGFPRYNMDVMPREFRYRLWKREQVSGMTVLRINAPNFYSGSRLSRKLVQVLAPPVLGARSLLTKKPDIVYTTTPPILMGHAAIHAAKRHGVPSVVNVQDLFPQNMIDLGIVQNKRLISLFESWERTVYKKATAITVMSDGNREFVVNRGAAAEKVHTVFNWVDTNAIQPLERLNPFRQRNDLPYDKFVVGFAGTMGASQDLAVVVDAARRLQSERDIVFLFVGDGTERRRLEAQADGLDNVRFLPMQSKATYPFVLASFDACVATLLPTVKTPTVPSKISTIMAAGRPVLAALPSGDATRLIQDANAGIVVSASDDAAFADAIMRLKSNPNFARACGDSGRRYVESHLGRDVCIDRLESVFEATIAETNGRH